MSLSQNRALVVNRHWTKVAQKMHRRAVKMYTARTTWANRTALASTLAEIRRLQLFKDIGYKSWKDYCTNAWPGAHANSINDWSRITKLYDSIPDMMRVAPPGIMGLKRLSSLAGFVGTAEEMYWWGNLARITNWGEWQAIVAVAKHAQRCGHPAGQTHLIVGFVDEPTYRRVVSRAQTAARKELGPRASMGDVIAWACARATGRPVPRSVGGLSSALGTHPSSKPGRPPVPQGGRHKDTSA